MIMFRNKKLLERAYNILVRKFSCIEKSYFSLIGFKNIQEEKESINILNKKLKA